MSKTIVKQLLITIYSDGTSKSTEVKLNRKTDAKGRFVAKDGKPKKPRPLITVSPDSIPGLDEHGNVTRRVTCPDCGLVFVRTFKIVKD